MDYAVFTPLDEIEDPQVELFSPREGDPADYCCVKLKSGKRIAITNTCAANALGLVDPQYFSYGSAESARKAMQPVADYIGVTVDELATKILTKAYEKIEPVIMELAEKYNLEHDQISLVGVGGGAAALIGFISEKMDIKYSIPENAEVISSIGVALALVRDVVERVIPNPSPQEIKNIKKEVVDKAVESGADPSTIEVHIEIDSVTSKVTAIALGSTEVKTTDLLKECSEQEAYDLAKKDFGADGDSTELLLKNSHFYVFANDGGKGRRGIRILDRKGFIKVQRADGLAEICKAGDYKEVVKKYYEDMAAYLADSILRPDFYLCIGARIMDFSGTVHLEDNFMLMDLEVSQLESDEEIIVVGVKNKI